MTRIGVVEKITDILIWYVPLSVVGHLCIFKQGYLMTGWFHKKLEKGFS